MDFTRLYRSALYLAILLLLLTVYYSVTQGIESAGIYFVTGMVLLSISFRGFSFLKGLAFTVFILSVTISALYYPGLYLTWGGFEMAVLITPLIQLIMFGTGCSMGIKDFIELSRAPKSVVVGVIAQYTIMPLVALILAKIFGFEDEIAAGVILLGCAPTSVTASLFSYLAKANVALAITVTSITTLLAPLLIPLLMKVLAGGFIEIDVLGMMWGMVKIVLLPIAAGLIFNKLTSGRAQWLQDAMPYVSMAGIALIVAIIIAAGRESILNIGFLLMATVLLHNLLGYFFGYWASRLLGLNERDSRTIAIATGMQNAGMVSGIAKVIGKIGTVGLASAVCGPIMGFTASVLSSYWSGRPTDKTEVP